MGQTRTSAPHVHRFYEQLLVDYPEIFRWKRTLIIEIGAFIHSIIWSTGSVFKSSHYYGIYMITLQPA